MKFKSLGYISDHIIAIWAGFSVWLVITDTLEYLVTEYKYIFDRLPRNITSISLYFVVAFIVFYFQNNILSKKLRTICVIFSIFICTGHIFYNNLYFELKKTPRIKSLNKNWTIQGDIVTITGKNFGAAHEQGRVIVGNLDFQIKKWSNYKIVALQPVPEKYHTTNLIICNDDQHCSTPMQFSIRDPADVL